jgi:hypothetical protein
MANIIHLVPKIRVYELCAGSLIFIARLWVITLIKVASFVSHYSVLSSQNWGVNKNDDCNILNRSK